MDSLVEQGTLQSTNLSHLGKRKIIDSKVPAGKGHVISQECTLFCQTETTTSLVSWSPNSGPNLSRVFGGSHGVSASKPLFFKQMWYFWWLKSCELIVAYIYINIYNHIDVFALIDLFIINYYRISLVYIYICACLLDVFHINSSRNSFINHMKDQGGESRWWEFVPHRKISTAAIRDAMVWKSYYCPLGQFPTLWQKGKTPYPSCGGGALEGSPWAFRIGHELPLEALLAGRANLYTSCCASKAWVRGCSLERNWNESLNGRKIQGNQAWWKCMVVLMEFPLIVP